MANYSIKTDLLKLKGAFVTNLRGKTATKRCLIIPVDEAGLFVGEKGVYLNLTAIEMQNPKFSETHCVKVSLDKERYDAMTEEERQECLENHKPKDGERPERGKHREKV